jgi:AsmA family protein
LKLPNRQGVYPIKAYAQAAKTQARLGGYVVGPLKLKGFNLSLWIKGPNPQRLHDLLGVPLPNLPPYEIKGRLLRQAEVWRFEDFQGTVRDSDLAGDIAIFTQRAPRPLLVADLVAHRLDFDDLGGLVGQAPKTGPVETASSRQKSKAKAQTKSKGMFPNTPLPVKTLKEMDVRVSYKVKRVESKLPINGLRIQAKLQDGRLTLKPLNFGVGGGDIESRIVVEASDRPVQAAVKADISKVNLKAVLRPFGFATRSVGNIGGRARLKGRGNSVADVMASLNGRLSLIMKAGELNGLLVELVGLDLTEVIAELVGGTDPVPILCGFADLKSRNGQVAVKSFVVDTTDTRFTADGSINLGEESVNILIVPHPKDFSLFAASTPMHITGTFNNLEFSLSAPELVDKTASAVVLGLVATPLAAIIPFIETGTGKDSECTQLLNTSKHARRAKQTHPSKNVPPALFIEERHDPSY